MPTLENTLALLHLLGDETRVRLLALVEREELTVAELTSILELSQSRVSTHLGHLKQAGLVSDRKAGVASFYLNESEDAGRANCFNVEGRSGISKQGDRQAAGMADA